MLEKIRQVISDQQILQRVPIPDAPHRTGRSRPSAWIGNRPTGTDLAAHAAMLLDAIAYRTSVDVRRPEPHQDDALSAGCRGQAQGAAPPIQPRRGLERVMLDGDTYVEHIAYNAKGQRTFIAWATAS